MALSLSTQLKMFRYIMKQRMRGIEKYPLVLMLEPLFACNLKCAGCGKIQYPPDILRKRMTPEECWKAAEECGAPVVSVAGGEPLVHEQMPLIVSGLIERGKHVYLCTNALLLESKLHKFSPSSLLTLSIHLDGPEKTHDRIVCREGVYRTAIAGIRKAKAEGFNVMTNTTIFQGESSAEYRRWFDECMGLGLDGMMLSPGHAYEKVAKQELFLKNEQTKAWFRETLQNWRKKGWAFNHSPFYMDFLEGKRDYDCTPWGVPTRNILGWQRPCYLMAEGDYAETYQELIETTDWKKYGLKSGNPRCINCMLHGGFEPSAVMDMFSSPRKFLQMVFDVATIKKPTLPAPRRREVRGGCEVRRSGRSGGHHILRHRDLAADNGRQYPGGDDVHGGQPQVHGRDDPGNAA